MRNDYRIDVDGSVVVMLWDYGSQSLRECRIDASDLPAISEPNTTWYANPARKSKTKWYATAKVWTDGRVQTVLMHRLVLGLTDPAIEAHHRDNDGLNNRRKNLQEVSHIENCRLRDTDPRRDWEAYDAAQQLAVEYRTERSISAGIAQQFSLTRQAVWCIRKRKTTVSPAAIAYQDACAAAHCRPFWRIVEANPVAGKKFGAVRVIRVDS